MVTAQWFGMGQFDKRIKGSKKLNNNNNKRLQNINLGGLELLDNFIKQN